MAYGMMAKMALKGGRMIKGMMTKRKGRVYPGGVESPPLPKVGKPAVRTARGVRPENPLSRMDDSARREFSRRNLK